MGFDQSHVVIGIFIVWAPTNQIVLFPPLRFVLLASKSNTLFLDKDNWTFYIWRSTFKIILITENRNCEFPFCYRLGSPPRLQTTRLRCFDKHSPFHQLLTNPILHFNMLQSKWIIKQIFFNNLSLCDLLYHVVLFLKFGIVLKRESFCCCPWTWCKAVFTPSASVDAFGSV